MAMETGEPKIPPQPGLGIVPPGAGTEDQGVDISGYSPARSIVHGTVAVQDGRVVVTDPEGGGEPALLLPGPNLSLKVDGRILNRPVKVASANNIEVKPDVVEPIAEIQTRVSSDHLEAFLRIERKDGACYSLPDTAVLPQLALVAELSEVLRAEVRREDVDQRLEELGIVVGVDKDAIERALVSPGKEVLVARGEPPVSGADGYLVWLKEQPSRSELLEGAGIIGFRPVISAEAGDLLAVKVSPRPGKPGRSVYGSEISPPQVRDIQIKAGAGTEVQGDRIVAKIAGRPDLRGNTVFVYQSLSVQGDAEAKGGYIRFKGDVVVKGNMLDGMRVEARGRVEVQGYVANAVIDAGGDVIIRRNIIGSQVRAGGSSSQYNLVADGVRKLRENCQDFLTAVTQLEHNDSFRQLQLEGQRVILQNLLDGRFFSLRKELQMGLERIRSWHNELAEDSLISSEEWEKLLGVIQQAISLLNAGNLPQVFRVEVIRNIFMKLEGNCLELEALLEGLVSKRSEVVAAYLQNSRVWASGGVRVTGRGSYGSTIVAGGPVIISGSPGVCIGGSLSARGHVETRELGSPGETPTQVEVPRGFHIKAQKVHPGVTLKAGARVERVLLRTYNLNFTED